MRDILFRIIKEPLDQLITARIVQFHNGLVESGKIPNLPGVPPSANLSSDLHVAPNRSVCLREGC